MCLLQVRHKDINYTFRLFFLDRSIHVPKRLEHDLGGLEIYWWGEVLDGSEIVL